MKHQSGRPRESGKLSSYKNPKLVLIDKASEDGFWYKPLVGTMVIVCDSDNKEFGYDVLEKMNNGKFAYNGRHVMESDVSYVCDVV